MTRFLIAAVAVFMLAGCSVLPKSWQASPQASVYAVPVAEMCPVPVLPEKPTLAIAEIQPETTHPEPVIAAYADSLNTCISRTIALEIILNGYQK